MCVGVCVCVCVNVRIVDMRGARLLYWECLRLRRPFGKNSNLGSLFPRIDDSKKSCTVLSL